MSRILLQIAEKYPTIEYRAIAFEILAERSHIRFDELALRTDLEIKTRMCKAFASELAKASAEQSAVEAAAAAAYAAHAEEVANLRANLAAAELILEGVRETDKLS